MKLSEDAAEAVILSKHLFDAHVKAIQRVVADLHKVVQKDIPEFTEVDVIHFLENFELGGENEN